MDRTPWTVHPTPQLIPVQLHASVRARATTPCLVHNTSGDLPSQSRTMHGASSTKVKGRGGLGLGGGGRFEALRLTVTSLSNVPAVLLGARHRWVSLACGVLMQLCAGTLYSVTAWGVPLKETAGWDGEAVKP